mmetsp:Transcript_7484/g.11100  ORF Transcript_7484/g.11100 Transcript_7484/m.11100 type:complete len:239 (-) Transcript_7484:47-763(-)
MGAINSTIKEHIENEFNRVKRNKKVDYLTIEEAILLESLDELDIHFNKIPVIFMLDVNKDGKITLDDIMQFSSWVGSITEEIYESNREQFTEEVHGQCTLYLWKEAYYNQEDFCNWFVRLFSAASIVHVPRYPDIVFVTTDVISILHDILNVQENFGMNVQIFISILQHVGEEKNMLNLSDTNLDDVLPATVIKILASHFIQGYLDMMVDLGFDYHTYFPVHDHSKPPSSNSSALSLK